MTHLFVAGDDYLQRDAVFGVKPSLVVRLESRDDPATPEPTPREAPTPAPTLEPRPTPVPRSEPAADTQDPGAETDAAPATS